MLRAATSAGRAAAVAAAPPPAPPGRRDWRRRRRRARGRGRASAICACSRRRTRSRSSVWAAAGSPAPGAAPGRRRPGDRAPRERGGQLDQRVGDVGVAGPFGGGVAAPAPAGRPARRGRNGRRPASAMARSWAATATVSRRSARTVVRLGPRDGCLRPVIVAWATKMSPPPSSGPSDRSTFRARGDSDLGDGLRPGGPEVPARRVRRQRQLRPAARGLPDRRRRNVDGHAGDAGGQPGARGRAGDDAGRPPAAARGGRAPRHRRDAVAVGAGPLRRRLARARAASCRSWTRRAGGGGCGARRFCATSTCTRMPIPAEAFRDFAVSDGFTGPLARQLRGAGRDRRRGADRPRARRSGLVGDRGARRRGADDRRAGGVGRRRRAEPRRRAWSRRWPPRRPTTGHRGRPSYATASAAPPAEDGTPQVSIRGAVLLRVSAAAPLDDAQRGALPLELRAAVEEPRAAPAAELWRLLAADGRARWAALAVGVALAPRWAQWRRRCCSGRWSISAAGRGGGSVGSIGMLARFAARLSGGAALGRRVLARVDRDAAGRAARAGVAARRAACAARGRGSRSGCARSTCARSRACRTATSRAGRSPTWPSARTSCTDCARCRRWAGRSPAPRSRSPSSPAGLVWLDPRGAPAGDRARPGDAAGPVRRRAGGGRARSADAQPRRARWRASTSTGCSAWWRCGRTAPSRRWRASIASACANGSAAARRALAAALTAEAAQTVLGLALAVRLLVGFFARGDGVRRARSGHRAAARLLGAVAAGARAGADRAGPADPGAAQPDAAAARAARRARGRRRRRGRRQRVARAGAPRDVARRARRARRRARGGRRSSDPARSTRSAIAPGEAVAIVGASGAGKSSLVGLLLGWHRPATGTVRVDGAPLDGAGIEALRRRTVWIDPAVYLWNRSLADNLAFGLAATARGARRPCSTRRSSARWRAGCREGLATPLGEAGGLVSGGEGQRVRFGRGLLRERPRLVILDEPFRGLSRDQRQALLERARRRWSSATLFCVTHDIAETAAFPRVLVIADGRVVEDGAPPALLAQPGSRYAALAEAERRVRAARLVGRALAAAAARSRSPGGGASRGERRAARTTACGRSSAATSWRRRWRAAAGIAQPGPADRFELSYADVAPALSARARAEAPAVLRVGRAARARSWASSAMPGADVRLLAPGGDGRHARRRGAVGASARAGRGVVARRASTRRSRRRASRGARGESVRAALLAAALGGERVAEGDAARARRGRRSAPPCAPPASGAGWRRRSAATSASSLCWSRSGGRSARAPSRARAGIGGGGWGWIAPRRGCWPPSGSPSSCAAGRLAIDAGAVLRERILHGLLRLDTEPLRAAGIGQLMGRVADVEAVESLALGGGLTAAVGMFELATGLCVLALGAAPVGQLAFAAAWGAGRRRARRRACSARSAPGRPSGWRSRTISSNGWSGSGRWSRRSRPSSGTATRTARSPSTPTRGRALDRAVAALTVVRAARLAHRRARRSWRRASATRPPRPGALRRQPGRPPLRRQRAPQAGAGVPRARRRGDRLAEHRRRCWRATRPARRLHVRDRRHASPATPSPRAVTARRPPPTVRRSRALIEARGLGFRYPGRARAGARRLRASRFGAAIASCSRAPRAAASRRWRRCSAGCARRRRASLRLDGVDAERARRPSAGGRASAPRRSSTRTTSSPPACSSTCCSAAPGRPAARTSRWPRRSAASSTSGRCSARMPSGLEQLVGESGWQLSHGERGRPLHCAFAFAAARRPHPRRELRRARSRDAGARARLRPRPRGDAGRHRAPLVRHRSASVKVRWLPTRCGLMSDGSPQFRFRIRRYRGALL